MGLANEEGRTPERVSTAGGRPAVGAIVTKENQADVARLVLWASHEGFPVVLTYDGLRPKQVVFFEREDVVLAHPDDPSPTRGELVALLARTAEDRGFPALVYHDDPDRSIDYAKSVGVVEGDGGFVVESETRPPPSETVCEVLVAIPAYNEAATIGEVVSRAQRHADEVLVVEDSSEDDTAARAAEYGASVIVHSENRGYGAALRTAFREADRRDAGRLVTLDADGQHDPADVPRFVEALEKSDADVVIGSRFEGVDSHIPRYRRVGLAIINLLTNFGLGTVRPGSWISDTQCGFRAYDREPVRALARRGQLDEGMSASTDILYDLQRWGYEVDTIGIEVDYDVENGNSQHPLTHGLSVIAGILERSERERALVSALVAALLVLVGLLTWFVSVVLHELNARLRKFADRNSTERRFQR